MRAKHQYRIASRPSVPAQKLPVLHIHTKPFEKQKTYHGFSDLVRDVFPLFILIENAKRSVL